MNNISYMATCPWVNSFQVVRQKITIARYLSYKQPETVSKQQTFFGIAAQIVVFLTDPKTT